MSNDFKSIYILGVRVDIVSKEDIFEVVKKTIDRKETGYVATPYSEFFLKAQSDPEFKHILNESLISAPDGVFTQWASTFLEMKVVKSKFFSFFQILFQFVYSGASIIFNRKLITKIIPNRISGSTFIYDICEFAQKNNYTLAFLGGFDFGNGNTGIIAKRILEDKYPRLKISEVYPGDRKEEFGEVVINILRKSKAQILICCYNPVRQEKWLYENLEKTGINVGFALGGTLDYVSGEKKLPPVFLRKIGLEWLFRPFYAEGKSLSRMIFRMNRSWVSFIKVSLLTLKTKLKGRNWKQASEI